ncbi:MAG: ADYC domain-containing protein [Nannocystaceae bacterium]|nr:ADYC domain-containing protein [bacterium]
MPFLRRVGLLFLGSLSLTACDTSAEELGSERKYYAVGGGWGCPTCDFRNSPHFGLYPIDDFRLGGGGQGVSLQSIEDPGGDRHVVEFVDSALVARTKSGDFEGIDLLDWTLIFELGGSETRVRVEGFALHPDWIGGAEIPTYALGVLTGPQGEETLESVCPGLSFEETNVVFTPGETYDPVALTVQSQAPDRVTMACRGHAVAKLKFLGHDPGDAYGSSVEARQAALKMLTADYCGDGQPHTTIGHPLNFADDLGLFDPHFFAPASDMEARWNEDGAVCLNEPRNAQVARGDVTCDTPLPTCSGQGLAGALWSSYAPKNP